jgi:hypothetical protein
MTTASTGNSSNPSDLPWSMQRWLLVLAFAAIAAGIYGRFKGLGTWPLGIDEFYLSRSIDNVLRTGLPEFACGGYYVRGLLYQYLIAALRLGGMSPELAGRLITAICSLAVLPAAYLLARRVQGRTVGLLVVTVLAVSVWEIEMARFARMYAPFQAVFTWYLVFFLRYTLDRDPKALVAMILLSILGVLTWEGGALIGLLNLLPPLLRHDRGRLRAMDWVYLGGMMLLFVFLYAASTDLRWHSIVPALAAEVKFTPVEIQEAPKGLWMTLKEHPAWGALAVLPAGLALMSLTWIWSLRERWLAAVALCVVLLAGLFYQFLICAAILLLLLLAHILHWRELFSRSARYFWLSMVASAVFWLAFGLFGDSSNLGANGSAFVADMIALGRQFIGFPNVIDEVARPWGATMPLLSLGVFLAISALIIRAIVRADRQATTISALLIALIVLILAIGASGSERNETRYSFFLYPLVVTLTIAAFAAFAARLTRNQQQALIVASLASLIFFGLTEDFKPRHIAAVDSVEFNFRVGMSPAQISHFYPHHDVRGAAKWLTSRIGERDIVISGIPSLDQYYAATRFFFLDEQDERYQPYACLRGTVDRWTNRPLLYGNDALASQLVLSHQLVLVLYPSRTQRVVAEAQRRGWQYERVWSSVDGGVDVLVLKDG